MKKNIRIIIKRLIIMISAIILFFLSFIIYREIKLPSVREFYIVDFKKINRKLTEYEKNNLVKCLELDKGNFEEPYFIDFTKVAYKPILLNESECYIIFKTNKNLEDDFFDAENCNILMRNKRSEEYVYKHVCFGATSCEKYEIISRIVNNHYKWWEDNEKMIDKAEIY